jgi:protease I
MAMMGSITANVTSYGGRVEKSIQGKRVAILATDGVEQSELQEPRRALMAAGIHTDIVSPKGEQIRAWKDNNWGDAIKVDVSLQEADEARYDALMLPGGVKNPDILRMDERAVAFVRRFFESGKPIAAICHGPWLLAEAGVLEGCTVTSWRSIKTDLVHAGATWVDQQVVTDEGLVTSRQPSDIPAFSERFIEEIREGRHERHTPRRAA